MYERFRILLDDPAAPDALGLNFDDYAAALAELIEFSKPQFAMAIFGAWGSGKTTLMRAVEHSLVRSPDVTKPQDPTAAAEIIIPVWFNAWRYEKEPHLIVPLLDTLRESLVAWVDEHPRADQDEKSRVMKVAATMARAGRAVLAGLSMNVGLPGALDISLEANKALVAWQSGGDPVRSKAEEPQSFYHASFRALREAVATFTDSGEHRIVVFVDDLDRCLPKNALQVLESMKLFFDLTGFVFVVGLDQDVIERAVRAKYPSQADVPYISGANYLKKIFQVPFAVPRVDESQLESFINAIIATGGLEPAQIGDLRYTVTPHLPALTGNGTVNPREVKRFINAYTLQMKMLERKLGPGVANANIVLALQALNFRADWSDIYEMLVTDTEDAQRELADAVKNDWASIAVAARSTSLPTSLRLYLGGIGAWLLNHDLNVYVSTLESTTSSNPAVAELMRAIGAVRRAIADTTDTASLQTLIRDLSNHERFASSVQSSPAGAHLLRTLQQTAALTVRDSEIGRVAADVDRLTNLLGQMEGDLRELRRATDVGATSAA